MSRDKFRIFVAYHPPLNQFELLPEDAIRIQFLGKNASAFTLWRDLNRLGKLRRFIKKHNIQLIHTEGSGVSAIYGQALARLANIPVVHTYQHSSAVWSRTDRVIASNPLFRKFFYGLVDCFVAAGKIFADELVSDWKIPKEKIYLNYHSADIELFKPLSPDEREKAAKEIGADRFSHRIGYIGRPDPVKGLGTLFELTAALKKHLPKIGLLAFGVTIDDLDFKERVQSLGIEENVAFYGIRRDLYRTGQAMDMYVQAGHYPLLGFTSIEMNACGIPHSVIIREERDKYAAQETTIENENGIFIDVREMEKSAAKLAKTLQDRELLRKMGERSRMLAEERFDWREHIKRLENLYIALIEEGRIPE